MNEFLQDGSKARTIREGQTELSSPILSPPVPSFETTPSTERNPSSDLLFIINQIVECDNRFCPELKDMYSDGLAILMQIKYPEMHRDLIRCSQQGRTELECSPFFVEGIARVNPLFHQMVHKRRMQVQPDPLGPSYDGLLYNAPFWFEGAGDIWRRTLNGSVRVSIAECSRIKRESEQCLNDPSKPTDYCFRLYAGAVMCEPGTNCPYMHFPLLRCAQTAPGTDFQWLNNCFKTIPNFESCTQGFVPIDSQAIQKEQAEAADFQRGVVSLRDPAAI
jgi:hypothetical protein